MQVNTKTARTFRFVVAAKLALIVCCDRPTPEAQQQEGPAAKALAPRLGVPADVCKLGPMKAALSLPASDQMPALLRVLRACPDDASKDRVLGHLSSLQGEPHLLASGAVEVVYKEDACAWQLAVSRFPDLGLEDHPCRDYPSSTDIRARIGALRKFEGNSPEARAAVESIFANLELPRNTTESAVLADAVFRLGELFAEGDRDFIAQAVDELDVDGGYATSVCMFYKHAWDSPPFLARYGDEGVPRGALKRCLGVGVSEEDFPKLRTSP